MRTLTFIAGTTILSASASAQWVTFVNESATRLSPAASLMQANNLEKDFAFGDYDHDGDIDLVSFEKFPGSIQGGFPNRLLMNEGGMLTDRTSQYGIASDVAGSQGMLDATNDRDVKSIDVNLDGWLDLVTCTTMSDGIAQYLGQPRVYMNLKANASGQWLGFRFEDNRIPTLVAANGTAANPRFCEFASGDLTGDGYPDLFFADYDTPETSGTVCIDLNGDGDTSDAGECQQSPGETASHDYQNKLLINLGAANPGFFVDSTTTRLTAAQLAAGFGNAAEIADMNGDGLLDIVRTNTLTGGQATGFLYNTASGGSSGNVFVGPHDLITGSPYEFAVSDLNGDGRLDIVDVNDGVDKYWINTATQANGQITMTSYSLVGALSEFGNAAHCADIDNDGDPDCIIVDVDADLPSFCPTTGRRTHIYQNTGSTTQRLQEIGNVIPNASLAAWFDVAIFDINGDGWLDMVSGACSGIRVWMNSPPLGLSFDFPAGVPTAVRPNEVTTFAVNIAIAGGGSVVSGSAKLFTRIDGGAWAESPLTLVSGTSYQAALPSMSCGHSLDFSIAAMLSNAGSTVYSSPATGTANPYSAIVTTGSTTIFESDFESNDGGMTVTNDGTLTIGAWARADPNGTIAASGAVAEPTDDHTPAGTQCFVTYPAPAGTPSGSSDVDGGSTTITSQAITTAGVDVSVSFWRWVFCDDSATTPSQADSLVAQVSVDGGGWVTVDSYTGLGGWNQASFLLSTFATPGQSFRLRFTIGDNPNNSVTEAAVDDILVSQIQCDDAPPCPTDINGDGITDGADMGALLAGWGTAQGDITGDGITDGSDLAGLLSVFGTACP
ncbi:MAG: VCBS repeat-containing protein [Planctomycetota bacterium]|nr:VCBS repeat-containing protein [Planctomycetota bacterium]